MYDWDVTTAFAVCMAESGGNTGATGRPNYDGSVDRGLMQVNSIHADMVDSLESLYDPATNLKVAYSLYTKNHDFTPWSAFNNGQYKKYL